MLQSVRAEGALGGSKGLGTKFVSLIPRSLSRLLDHAHSSVVHPEAPFGSLYSWASASSPSSSRWDVLFDYLDLVVNRGGPEHCGPALRALPGYIVALSVPLAPSCVATLMTFGRLSQDNEITALRAGGVNLASVILFALIALRPGRGRAHPLQQLRPARVEPRVRQPPDRHRPDAPHGQAPGGVCSSRTSPATTCSSSP